MVIYAKDRMITIMDKFNEMITDIGALFFDLQQLMGRFVAEVFDAGHYGAIEVYVPLINPYTGEADFCVELYFDDEEGLIRGKLQSSKILDWGEMDVATQYELAQAVHMKYVSDNLMENMDNEIH